MAFEPKHLLRDALLWSERHTRTDMRYLASGGFWLSLGRIVGMVASLALAVAMANLLSPTVYGIYQFVLSAAGIIGAFSLAGIGPAITQAVARGFNGALRAGAREYSRWSFLVVGIALSGTIYYFINDNVTLATSLFIVGIFHPIYTRFALSSNFLAGKKDFRRQSLHNCIRSVVPSIALILAVFTTNNPVLVVLTYFISHTIVSVLLYKVTVRVYQPDTSTDPRTNFYALHLSVMGFINKIAEYTDKILIFHFLGAAPLAIYAFAQIPINQLKMFNDIPARLAFPKLSERSLSELQQTLLRKLLLLMVSMFVIVIAYVLFAPLIFQTLFPQYLDSIILSQALALTLVFAAPASILNETLTAQMRKRELYVSQLILPSIKIGLLIILLPLYGIWGAVVTLLVSSLITFTLYAFLFWRAV